MREVFQTFDDSIFATSTITRQNQYGEKIPPSNHVGYSDYSVQAK